jgi:hypothetical protein
VLLLSPNISGIFSLITESRANLTKVIFSGLPFVVEASSTFPLKTFNTEHTYAAYVKTGKTRLKLRANCFSNQESAFVIIHSPENKIKKETEIVEFTEINIPLQASQESLKQNQNGTHIDHQLSFQLISGQAISLRPKPAEHILGVGDNPNFLAITITPVPSKIFEDIQLYFYSEEFPYLITRNLDIPENRQK